jgi:16S rRNA (uracil1498-N3)-methyltransferase
VAGASVDLAPDEAHHVRRVLRLRVGEPVAVFDGKGQEWRAVISRSEAGRITLTLESRLETAVEAPLEVGLYQGLCKPDRMDWIVQKATELGVATIHPFLSRRSVNRRPSAQRLERWRRIALEACKQCGRRSVPLVDPCVDLPAVAGDGTVGFLLDAGGEPFGAGCAGLDASSRVWIAVGPESGFEEQELRSWRARGWRRAGLGPRTLRAETAAVVSVAILLNRLGDLGRPTG